MHKIISCRLATINNSRTKSLQDTHDYINYAEHTTNSSQPLNLQQILNITLNVAEFKEQAHCIICLKDNNHLQIQESRLFIHVPKLSLCWWTCKQKRIVDFVAISLQYWRNHCTVRMLKRLGYRRYKAVFPHAVFAAYFYCVPRQTVA